MLIDLLASWLGALIASLIVYNLFYVIFFKFLDKKLNVIASYIGSVILILTVTTFTVGLELGFIYYMPPLFLVFLWDFIKFNKKKPIALIEKSPNS